METGTLDGRVELRELLGAGGMGEVHAAWDRSLQRPVAVKFVRGSDPREAERLLLEARLQARVEHPHVVRVFEVGSLEGRSCVLFQLVRGRSLGELAASLSVAERVELCRQAASGLHAAHLEGLVHRDVKPGNILVEEGEDGRRVALVTDFGLAHAEEGGLTRSGLLPGTLDFMAPEQLAGTGPIDFRSDVYALGATLYAVLAGRPPFRIPSAKPGAEEQVKLLRRILDEEPPSVRSVVPRMPRDLSLVIQKAMEKEPAARYGSAEAFADDLSRFQRGEPVDAKPTSPAERLLKWARRNTGATRALAAAALALLAAGAFALWQARQASAEALEAARLGALAASLESRMRMEYLSPPHDLRPTLAEVKSEVEALRPLAERRGGGPASFALGKGLELLGELDGARAAYQRAWDLGFHTPQTAEGLGMVLARIFERERQRAESALAPGPRARRIDTVQAELLAPARRLLESADRSGWRGMWLDASVALLAGDGAAAREKARKLAAQESGLYEALLLEGRALHQESVALQGRAQVLEARKAVDEAIDILGRASEGGRSDPKVARALAEAHLWSADILMKSGGNPGPGLRTALSWADRAQALDPLDGWSFVFKGQALVDEAIHKFDAGQPGAWEGLREGIASLRRAREIQPRDGRTLALLAYGLYRLASRQLQVQEPADDALAEGLGAIEAGLALAPNDPLLHLHGMYIGLEAANAAAAAGRGTAEAFQRVVDSARAAIEGGTRFPALARQTMTSAMLGRGTEQWRAGRDPRAGLAEAVQLADEMAASAPQSLPVRSHQAFVIGSTLEILLAFSEDARALTERGLAVTDDLLRMRPNLAGVHVIRAEMLLLEARRRVGGGEDASGLVSEAERWLARSSSAGGEDPNSAQDRGLVHLLRARILGLRGRDPSRPLERAEAIYRGMAARQPDRSSWHASLAACAVERALWARRRGRGAGPWAGAGLDALAKALRLDERDPELPVLQGRLHALAGDRAAARASLDRAYAMQPLVKGSREARAAEAALATGGAVP